MNYSLLLTFLLVNILFQNSLGFNDDILENHEQVNKTQYSGNRLPNTTKPLSYNINLFTEIHKGVFNFSGSVSIHIKVISPAQEIVLHSKFHNDFKLNLSTLNNSFEIPSLNYTYNYETELLHIYSENEVLDLNPGEEYILNISYKGLLRDDNAGFFKISYKDWENDKLWIAASQFEPTDARHAFPCFDEPSFKAKFSISIVHGQNYIAISNMPVISKTLLDDDLMITKFEESPNMSTYLVAFVISNFQSISGHDSNNFTQRVFSRPGITHDCSFALDTSLRTFEKIEEYFEIPYSLPKMDHIGIPNASSLAMENWGLIIYKEQALLTNHTTPSRMLFEIVTVINHEYVHQLFGNLVTPKWWTWTWLSEGFATFYSHKISDMLFPDWNMKDYYFITPGNTYNLGLYYFDSQPMTHYVETPRDIMKSFHWVSYNKACAVIRTFESAMGEKTFRKGIKKYLQKFQYSVAEEDDLFECLQEAAIEDKVPFFSKRGIVRESMKSWTNQGGYPLLTVNRNYNNDSITIHQEIFIGDKDQPSRDTNSLWWIPINFVTASENNFEITVADILMPPNRTISDVKVIRGKILQKNDWLILNKQQTGFYRVNYDQKNWRLIINALNRNPSSIHKYNRAQLIKDAFTYIDDNKISIDTYLDLLSYLSKEKNKIVWNSIEEIFYDQWSTAQAIPKFGIFLKKLIRPIFMAIGYHDREKDSHLTKVARLSVVRMACSLDLPECSEIANAELQEVRRTGKEIDKHKGRYVYCYGFHHATDDDFEYFFNRMIWTDCTEERKRLITALSCSRNPKHLKQLLESVINQNISGRYTPNERMHIIEDFRNCIAISTAIEFLWSNYEEYRNLSYVDFHLLSVNPLRVAIMHLSQHICNYSQKNQLIILTNHTRSLNGLSDKDFQRLEDNIAESLNWITKHEEGIIRWLKSNPEKNLASQIHYSQSFLISVLAYVCVWLFPNICN